MIRKWWGGVDMQNYTIFMLNHRISILWTIFKVCKIAQDTRFAQDTLPSSLVIYSTSTK